MVESLVQVSPALEKLIKDNLNGSGLQPEQAVNQELAADFTCVICTGVVTPDMVECSNCNWLICGKCITEWTQHKQTCPHCQEAFVPTARPNRKLVNLLKEMLFICLLCPENFKYTEFQSHKLQCKGKPSLTCPLAHCGRSGIEDLQTHLLH